MGKPLIHRISILFVLAGFLTAPGLVLADDTRPAADDREAFFETRVRPVLSERCWRCHGDDKQSSGLRLDSREAMLEGGEQGPAIVPGKPEESLLIQAVRHDGEISMPPKGQPVPAESIADLSQWIRTGAHWPIAVVPEESKSEKGRSHWAFQPVWKPAVPPVGDLLWVATPVDAFILAQLEARGCGPRRRPTSGRLIRRATFDLIGLPPTPEEVDAFVADESPDAFAKVVDRLLASPHYGERWGRHWLDVARYADTKGYVLPEERDYPYAYTYRDYVIARLQRRPAVRPVPRRADRRRPAPPRNGDKPAAGGDGLPDASAGGSSNNADDIIDDRIDVVTRGMMGLTVACARCHDHKYDPIPTEDYYSLYGVFASSVEPKELPLLQTASPHPDFPDYEQKLQGLAGRGRPVLRRPPRRVLAELRRQDRRLPAGRLRPGCDPKHPKYDERVRDEKLRPELLRWLMRRWKEYLEASRDRPRPGLRSLARIRRPAGRRVRQRSVDAGCSAVAGASGSSR